MTLRHWSRSKNFRALHDRSTSLAEDAAVGLEMGHGYVLLQLRHYEEALQPLRKARQLQLKQFGAETLNASVYRLHETRALFGLGDFVQAQAVLDGAIVYLESAPALYAQSAFEVALATQADLCLAQGDLERARAAVAALAARPGLTPYSQALAKMASARIASAQGRHDAARAEFSAARALAEQHRAGHQRTLRQWRLVEAEIELAAGRSETVDALLEQWQAPEESATDWTRWRAADLRALAALQQGRIRRRVRRGLPAHWHVCKGRSPCGAARKTKRRRASPTGRPWPSAATRQPRAPSATVQRNCSQGLTKARRCARRCAPSPFSPAASARRAAKPANGSVLETGRRARQVARAWMSEIWPRP